VSEVTTEKPVIGRASFEKNNKTYEVLELGAGMRYPFRFGRGKARLLLEAIEKLGADGFANHLQSFVDEEEKN
jgi:hypothetical protein